MRTWKLEKFRLFVYVAIAMIFIFCIIGALFLWAQSSTRWYVEPWQPIAVNMSVTQNETVWKIVVTEVTGGSSRELNKTNWYYSLYIPNIALESGPISEIDGRPSLKYNITWVDKDRDGCLSVGDYFLISKSGGAEGKAESGYRFRVVWRGTAVDGHVELP
ncbi:MAG: hypothetical protein AB1485_05220 [Candidatus Thermoplasmatota archaeon]